MATAPTVNDPRSAALTARIARLPADPAPREAVVLGLVDALHAGDGATLSEALDALRDARAHADGRLELSGWLDAAIAFAYWGLERVPSSPGVGPGTQAHAFLRALDGSPQRGSAELRGILDVDETQVSRAGRRLLERGLVMRRKAGRQVFWQLTPRGREALDETPAAARPGDSEFWQEALRRGFDGAPAAASADPVRERVIECTLQLHVDHGIGATTWTQIAEKAGVPLDTLAEMFATPDELIRSCGEHFVETLRLPPHDRAPEVFSGTLSEPDRIRRLVETLFGAYERGALGLTVARRERKELPVVDESLGELESTFDALVAEALRPLGSDGGSVASVRALTDLEVWRTLRDQGLEPDAAVDETTAAVERWLGVA
jgi:DNA-binding MarR family transcriptional regulator/AcrR family transcriptional regulator